MTSKQVSPKYRGSRGISRRSFLAGAAAAAGSAIAGARPTGAPKVVYVVPNFHPASCGWLTNFSKERVYCANSYLDHLDRVRDDPRYAFVLSEVNNIIAIMNFQPQRAEEIRRYIKEGRLELVNAFFLESTINLSGGEALVRLGIEGLRWQKQIFGVRPRFAWTIDVCGTHDQMAQIAAGLGLEAMVYTRKNPTGSAIHWAESPDGTRVLALSPGHYSELRPVFATKEPLAAKQLDELKKYFEQKAKITPEGAPILVLAGSGDYSLAPLRKEYPSEFLRQWQEAVPLEVLAKSPESMLQPCRERQRAVASIFAGRLDSTPPVPPPLADARGTVASANFASASLDIRFTTLSHYLDAVLPAVKSGRMKIPTMRGGTAYDFNSFWIQNPRVKSWYRRCEHSLQAAEALATAASLQSRFEYPAQALYHAWLEMCLNMDRNTLWGAAGGMVFEHDKSWDARDRFQSVQAIAEKTLEDAGRALLPSGDGVGLFNPLNWKREDPAALNLPNGAELEGVICQAMPSGATLCRPALAPMSASGFKLFQTRALEPPAERRPEEVIETKHYQVRIDPKTGALLSLKLRPSGREVLGGPGNVLVAERPSKQSGDPGDHMVPRPARVRLASSSDSAPKITVTEGLLATTAVVEGEFFGGGGCRRIVRFYNDYPRIDFETELNDVPDRAVVVAEFPLAEAILEVRRGIPYGFSHGAWEKPNPELHGWTQGIVPAVRWSHYALASGGGLAILDRGLPGRELNDRTPIIYLLNATDKYYGYPNAWLSGKGKHLLAYAIVAHETGWKQARIPQMAWEYNCPPVVIAGRSNAPGKSFLQTSDNVIVEAVRRDGGNIEVRLAECLGFAGTAEVVLALPHKQAFLTDMVGGRAAALRGGPRYRFPVRPQQIVTLRFATESAAPEVQPLLRWDELVPEAKREALNAYSSEKGHPPRGN